MTQTSADARAPVATRGAWAALAVVAGGLFLAVMSTTVVSVALPTIGRHLHANATDLEWIVDAYVVVYASLLVPGGVIGDRRGRKGLFMLGVAIFGLGSLIAGLAPSVGLLLIGRVIQGLGPALLVPGSLTIIRTVFEDERQRAVALGLWSTASGLALAIGPALGGLLVDRFGWRWVFLFNVPLAAAFVVLATRFIPRLARTPIRSRFDWLGAILSTGAVAILAYASIEGQDHGWSSPLVSGAYILGVVALAGFVIWERHRTDSLIDVTLFARPTFTAANVAALVVFFAFVGSIVYFSAYFQQVQGHSPVAAGLDVSAIGIAFAVAASQSGRLVSRFGPRRPMLAGLVIAGVATLGLLRLGPNTGMDAIWWNFAVLGGGIGMCLTPMTAVAISAVDASRAGMVSAVHNSLRQLGQVFGVALLGALVYARLPGAAGPRLDRAQGALFVGGLHNALWVCGLALLAAAALAALLFSLPGPGNPGETDSQADEVPGGARRIGDRHPELPLAGQRPPPAGFTTDTAQARARSADPQQGPGRLRRVSAGSGSLGLIWRGCM
jgi:DHA2 family methylenomycin A resistance protein-like MFS transporter